MTINIPAFPVGESTYKSYSEWVLKIKTFKNHKRIGVDESGQHDMYSISIGDPSKPTLFIGGGLHGTEFYVIDYIIKTLEMIENDTYPESDLVSRLKKDFHILSIPIMNPYGLEINNDPYSQYGNPARYNVNEVDLNRDFYDFTQRESRNIRAELINYDIFAALDAHNFQSDYDKNLQILAGSQVETEYYRDLWAKKQREYTGKKLTVWRNVETPNPTSGLLRRFIERMGNTFTKHTLSYISEFQRPTRKSGEIVEGLTEADIFEYGMVSVYLFIKTSLMYFDDEFIKNAEEQSVETIITPNKKIKVKMSVYGFVEEVEEIFNDKKTIKSTVKRDAGGFVESINKQLL